MKNIFALVVALCVCGLMVTSAAAEMKKYTAQDVKSAINEHIKNKMRADGGLFKIYDPKEGYQELELSFVKIHDPVRDMGGGQYFACTDFAVKGNDGKLYDLDFWLNDLNGELIVTQTHIHKEPAKKSAGWEKVARYTFVNDEPTVVTQ